MKLWGLELQSLGMMVAELSETQLNSYVARLIQFEALMGRAPDYFEELDIIKQVKGRKICHYTG